MAARQKRRPAHRQPLKHQTARPRGIVGRNSCVGTGARIAARCHGSGALRFTATTVPRHTAQDLSTTQRTRLLQFAALLVRRMPVMAEGTMSINGQAVSLGLLQGERPTSAKLVRAWAVACTPYVANATP